MATAVSFRTPSRAGIGPALGRMPLPTTSILVSTLVHALGVAALVLVATVWRPQPAKTYIVNLVPAVPALGVPRGKPTTPTAPTPPRVEEPPPRTSKFTPAPDPPAREAPPAPPRPAPLPELPVRAPSAPEMPTRERPRESPALPVRDRPRENPVLPARNLPTREPALPRPGQKELPAVASYAPPRPTPALTTPAPAPPSREPAPALPASPPPPPAPLGRPTGTAQGAGAVLNTGGDFPFTWYLRAVERKVYEKWTQPLRAVDGQQAVVVFEIGRDGQVSRVRIEKPSGDALYDQAALRAVLEANPLPQLPPEFKEPPLRVHFGFTYGNRG